MIGKLDWTLRSALQDKVTIQKHTQWEQRQTMNKQQQNNHLKIGTSQDHCGGAYHTVQILHKNCSARMEDS